MGVAASSEDEAEAWHASGGVAVGAGGDGPLFQAASLGDAALVERLLQLDDDDEEDEDEDEEGDSSEPRTD